MFPGIERFEGLLVHPQKWPQDLAFENKRVIVIGSGATAVTLVPAMARTAALVTMLQRSPTYVVARPEQDAITKISCDAAPRETGLRHWCDGETYSLESTSLICASAVPNG